MLSTNQFEADFPEHLAREMRENDDMLCVVKMYFAAVALAVAAMVVYLAVVAFQGNSSHVRDDVNRRMTLHPADSQSTGVDAAPLFRRLD